MRIGTRWCRMMSNIKLNEHMRKFWLIVYYGIASKMPKSNRGVFGKMG